MDTRRLSLLDWARAIAILLMVAYHLVYDLNRFAGVGINCEAPFWYVIGKTSALLFIFLSAFCGVLSRHPVRRGFRLLSYGLGISAVTFLFLPDAYVRFGILHFLGVALILSPLLRALPQRLLPIFSFLTGLAGWEIAQLSGPTGLLTGLLLPFGLKYQGFDSIDYFPLLPYIGVTMLGIYVSKAYLQNRTPLMIHRVDDRGFSLSKTLSKHSLKIYLIHQPLILVTFFAWRWILVQRSGPSEQNISTAHAHLFPLFFMFWQHGGALQKLVTHPELLRHSSLFLMLGAWLGVVLILLGLLVYHFRARRTRE